MEEGKRQDIYRRGGAEYCRGGETEYCMGGGVDVGVDCGVTWRSRRGVG
jgi:hypothetical protein